MGLTRIKMFAGGSYIGTVKNSPLVRMLKRITKNLASMKPGNSQQYVENVDKIVSWALYDNFRKMQKTWRRISVLTALLSRERTKIKGSTWRQLLNETKKLDPLVDTGRLRNSLKPKNAGGGAEHVLRVIPGFSIQIGTRRPGSGKHIKGGVQTFKSPISWVRPGIPGVPGSGRPGQYTEINKKLFAALKPPRKQNKYFANKLRYWLYKNQTRSARLPVRSWLNVGRATVRKLARMARMTMVKK
jgi:hypothetical protein